MKRRFAAGLIAAFVMSSAWAVLQRPGSVPTLDFTDGEEFIVTAPYIWRIGSTDVTITIPAGFVTDYASIPWPIRGILQKQSTYSRAALIHDYLYWSQACSREQSDNLLLIAMKESHVPKLKRRAVYEGVVAGGWAAWHSNARERTANLPRVVPPKFYSLADDHSWREARTVLVKEGVIDPAFSVSNAACSLGNSTQVP